MKPARTLMATEELVPYEGKVSSQDIYIYQRKVGSLFYIIIITRPDVARVVVKLSEFLQNPLSYHHEVVNHAIIYLYETKTYAIEYFVDIDS